MESEMMLITRGSGKGWGAARDILRGTCAYSGLLSSGLLLFPINH